MTVNFDQCIFRWYEGYGIWGHERDRIWFNAGAFTDWKASQPVTLWYEVGL